MKSCLALGRLGFGLPEIQNVPLALAAWLVLPNLPRSPCREFLLRKEVIQPHVPVRLPCYDFTLLTGHSLDGFFLAVRITTSSITSSHGLTGGVYKARERIHRGLADPRLLAIPTSCSRVADCNPNWDWLLGIRLSSRTRCPLYQPL